MFGEDDFAAELRRQTERLGITERVEFAGFVDDVPGLLAGCDCSCTLRVIAEPFGQVVIEGMAAGSPSSPPQPAVRRRSSPTESTACSADLAR